MAQVKVSDLPAASGLSTSDSVVINRSGVTSRTTAGAFTDTMTGFIQSGTGAVARSVQDAIRKLFAVNVLDFIPTNLHAGIQAATDTTNLTSYVVSANAEVVARGGGFLYFPAGVYNISAFTRTSECSWIGDGHFTSIIKCNTVGAAFITFSNISRLSDRDIQFDGNSNANVTWKFAATVGSSCGSMLFDHVYLAGALVDTVHLVASGGGSANDISHITFVQPYLRSAAPSNSQIRNDADNGLNIVFLGGIVSATGAGSPYNIHTTKGQITCFETFFSGSTTSDVHAAGGQVKIYGGRTEGNDAFFTSPASDTTGLTQAPHVIEGIQGSNAGTNFIYHQGTRVLTINGNQSAGIIRCGANGVIEKGTHRYSSAATVDTIDAGGVIRGLGTTMREAEINVANPAYEVFYKMTNLATGAHDFGWTATTALNEIALRNLTNSYNALFIQNANATQANIGLGGATSFASGEGVVAMTNAVVAPNTGVANQVFLYSSGGRLKAIDSAANISTLSAIVGSATFDPASLVDGAGETTTVVTTGAALGDFAEASFSLDLQGITLTAWVSSANTVSVRFQNETGGTLDLASGTLRARVHKA